MSRFKYDYLSTIINPELWDVVGSVEYLDTSVARLVVDLQQRKNAILRVCYNKKGEYAQPDLSRLNEDAFKELQRIDKEITKLTLQQGVDIDQKQGEMPFHHVIVKNPVMYNSEQTYFDHLLQQA